MNSVNHSGGGSVDRSTVETKDTGRTADVNVNVDVNMELRQSEKSSMHITTGRDAVNDNDNDNTDSAASYQEGHMPSWLQGYK